MPRFVPSAKQEESQKGSQEKTNPWRHTWLADWRSTAKPQPKYFLAVSSLRVGNCCLFTLNRFQIADRPPDDQHLKILGGPTQSYLFTFLLLLLS